MANLASLCKRNKLLRAGAVLVILAAVVPNVVYLGHGPTQVAHSHEAAEAETNGDHLQHCHAGASRCAGPQSLVGTWWIGDEAVPTLPEPVRSDSPSAQADPVEELSPRILHPPRPLA